MMTLPTSPTTLMTVSHEPNVKVNRARAALSALDEAQRIALAIEIVRDTERPTSEQHLLRLQNGCGHAAKRLRVEAMTLRVS